MLNEALHAIEKTNKRDVATHLCKHTDIQSWEGNDSA